MQGHACTLLLKCAEVPWAVSWSKTNLDAESQAGICGYVLHTMGQRSEDAKVCPSLHNPCHSSTVSVPVPESFGGAPASADESRRIPKDRRNGKFCCRNVTDPSMITSAMPRSSECNDTRALFPPIRSDVSDRSSSANLAIA